MTREWHRTAWCLALLDIVYADTYIGILLFEQVDLIVAGLDAVFDHGEVKTHSLLDRCPVSRILPIHWGICDVVVNALRMYKIRVLLEL